MRKIFLLLILFTCLITEAQVGARFKNKLLGQDFRASAVLRPVMFDADGNPVVDDLPAANIDGTISALNGGGLPTTPITGSWVWANSGSTYSQFAGNSESEEKVPVQYENGEPYFRKIMRAVTNNELYGDAMVRGFSGEYNNIHNAVIGASVSLQRAMGSTVFAESLAAEAVNADASALTDGQQRCVKVEVKQPRIVAKIGYILAVAGDVTEDQTNSWAIYSVDITTGAKTKLLETANSASIIEGAAGYREATLSVSDTLPAGLYDACIVANWSASVTAPQIGVKTSWSTNNGGLNAQNFSNSLKRGGTFNSQTSQSGSTNESSYTASNNLMYVQFKE